MRKFVISHGAVIELNLASEALGLARSLDWQICTGPRGVQDIKEDESEVEGKAGEEEVK